MTKTTILLFVIAILFSSFIWAQPDNDLRYRKAGLPFVQHFQEEGEPTGPLVQSSTGFMYVVENEWLYEYNGTNAAVPPRNRLDSWGSIYALVKDKELGIRYMGGEGDFGYLTHWKKDEYKGYPGYTKYVSLVNYVPMAFRDFLHIQNIVITKDAIYFSANGMSLNENRCIFRLDKRAEYTPDQIEPNDSMSVWKIENNFTLWGGEEGVFVQERYVGLKQIIGDTILMAPGGEQFNGNRVRLFIPLNEPSDNSDLSVLTNTAPGDLAIYENGTLTPFPVEPKLLAYLQKNRINHAIKLSNGHIAIATDYGAGLIMDQQGRWIQSLNEAIGLKSDNILGMAEDNQRGLWLATKKGVSRVEVLSPMTHFLATHGYAEEVEDFVKHEGIPYVLTDNDLLYLSFSDDPLQLPSMKMISENINGNCFLSVGEDLLMGASRGIYQIVNQKAEFLTQDIIGVNSLHLSPFDSTIIYVASYGSAVGILKKWDSQWYYIGQFDLIEGGINSIVEESPGKLWAGTSIDGVLCIEITQSSLELLHHWTPKDKRLENISVEVKQYTEEDGINISGEAYAKLIADRVVFETSSEIQRFDESTQKIVSETSFGADQCDDEHAVFKVEEDNLGNVYLYIRKKYSATDIRLRQIATSRQDKDGNWQVQMTQLNRMPLSFKEDYPFIYPDPDESQVIWLGGEDGLVRYDASLALDDLNRTNFIVHTEFAAWIIQDSVFTHDSKYHSLLDLYTNHKRSPLTLDYINKYFDFKYSSNNFDGVSENDYQVYLEGYDDGWSKWTKETQKVYTRLPEGDYTFRVRARNVYNQISEEGVVAFTITPPWYRSWWAYTIYWILFTLFVGSISYFYNKWQSRQLEERNLQLEHTVKERTEEIQVKNVQLNETLITLQQTQQQLILQEKLASLGQMVAGIAHEIKNPLNFVNNFAESSLEIADEFKEELQRLEDTLDIEDQQLLRELLNDLKENALSIHKNGRRADAIVNGMMDHANDNRGQRVASDINRLVSTQTRLAIDGYKANLENFNISVHQELDTTLPSLSINPQEVGRVIINLVNNACYALEEKAKVVRESFIPELRISTQKLDDVVEVRIRDNGLGIPVDIQSNIFMPFFTTKPTGYGNTGLGLSLSYDIITQGHGGVLIFESEKGEFTEFIISLPLETNHF